MQKLATEAFAP